MQNTQHPQEKSKAAQREEAILAFWEKERIFQKSIEKPAGNENPQEFVFYDGPPFATGLPHYGHLLQSFVKDSIPRYKTMRGLRVRRQWGWDCHGLPIENLVEKELGISGRDEIIEKVGVQKFNQICREKIFGFEKEWKKIITRIGRWADMEHPYKTMDTGYMESEWWAFKTLYEKGLVYEDFRSIHICPRCETTLSQSEVTEGYMDIKDLSVTVKFLLLPQSQTGADTTSSSQNDAEQLQTDAENMLRDSASDQRESANTYVLAWTTTPWTLPGNVALAVGEDIEYVKVESDGEKYIVAKERLQDVFEGREYKVLEELSVKDLVGRSYKPPFDYYQDKDFEHKENAWKIYPADFISDEDGTGIAHEAPAFGAEDMELARQVGLPLIQHVDMTGRFKPEVTDFAGMPVKPKEDHMATDVEIIKYLAAKGLLFDKKKITHSYPHCWRCDTPLLNYATTSWFVAVEKMKDRLLKNAEPIYWYPEHIKYGRWGKWLEGAKDWSISRNRFWANTIPVWRCTGKSADLPSQNNADTASPSQNDAEQTRNNAEVNGCGHEVVVGSIAELEELSGVRVNDLHKDVVDEVTFTCKNCGGTMRRIPDVLDTWFNSGSVPYATYHYPFENKEVFEKRNPADFIAEGQDQTRAWFYYQHVLATALFDRHAFEHVITTGIVLAEDGKKMAKKLQNYPDPMYLVDTYGADAVRLYMLGSPVVRAANLAFSEKEVGEVARKVLGRLVNVYEFYSLYKDTHPHETKAHTEHALDRWIVARLAELGAQMTEALETYALDRAVKPIAPFVDDLSTWYLRRSRERIKSSDPATAVPALGTLRFVLLQFAKLLAPLAPFHSDWLFRELAEDGEPESVHLAAWPELAFSEQDRTTLAQMQLVRDIISEALEARTTAGIRVRQPLASVTIYDSSAALKDPDMQQLIAEEVNVKKVVVVEEQKEPKVALDTTITPELKEEGELRELLRHIQQARKKAGLKPGSFALLHLTAPATVCALAEKYAETIKTQAFIEQINCSEGDSLQLSLEPLVK